MKTFFDEVKFILKQDHDYYHNSLMNQSLHCLSGFMNLIAIILVFQGAFENGVALFMISWGTRQSGHFFFESKDFDHKANKSFQEKEDEKIGANLERKLMMIGGLVLGGIIYIFFPSLLINFTGLLGHETTSSFDALMCFFAFVFVTTWVLRALWLIVFHSPLRGVCWFLKILYDPINDIVLYNGSPLKVLKNLKERQVNG